jgi:tetratricopeptide (TPR) repeat protein
MRTALWLSLGLGACVYPAAMRRGAELEGQGDLRGALASYERALGARPRSEEAREAREEVVAGAIGQALADGQGALAQGRYEEALEHGRYIQELDPEHAEAAALRVAVGDELVAGAEAALERQDWVKAYDWAAWTRDLVPERPEIASLLGRARDWFYATSEQKAAEGAYREALELLGEVSRREPDRDGEVEPRARTVRGQWASVLAGQADQRERQALLGPALALRARAWEVAQRPEDGQALARLAGVLRQQGQLSVALRWHGDRARHEHVWPALGGAGPLVWAEGGLVVSVETPPARCSDGWTASVAEQSYVAGQREVPNPQRAPLEQELAAARQGLAELAGLEPQALYRLQQAQAQVTAAEQQLGPLAQQMDKARDHAQSAQAQIEGASGMVAQVQGEIERLRAQGASGEAVLAMEMTLASARQHLQEQQDRLARAEQTLASVRPAWEGARMTLQAAHDGAAAARAELSALSERRGMAEQRVAALLSSLQSVPRSVWEDVVELFRYEVQHWTRSCAGEASVSLAGAGVAPFTHRYADAQQTWDDTHAAWPAYSVQDDPLAYPVPDAELVRLMDERIAQGVLQSLQRGVNDAYAVRLSQARELFASRPEEGAGPLMGLLLAAPSSVDPDTRARVEDWLVRSYELEAPSALLR